ncbi:MAG: hypothetical protein QW096_09250 [Thermofilaceae archaeon]
MLIHMELCICLTLLSIYQEDLIGKADEPTIRFLRPWTLRRGADYFFRAAKEFPEAEFIAMNKPNPSVRKDVLAAC